MYEELALYIDGEFRQGGDGAGEEVINPATEETLEFAPKASRLFSAESSAVYSHRKRTLSLSS